MPAYNVYKKYLGIENDENLFINSLEFPMMFEHNGVNIVRAVAAGNEDGSLVMSADVKEESVVRLSYGEPNTIMDAVSSAAMREGEGKKVKNVVFEDKSATTKLPLASRMATFIRETALELETINNQLKLYNEQLKENDKTTRKE